MTKKLQYIIGIVLLLAMPIRGMSQATGDAKADKAERSHRTHVVHKAWSGTKHAINTGAHATAHATGKAWSGTKHAVSTGAHATAHATGKAWNGTKRVTRTAVRAPGRAIHHAKVKHQADERQEGETK
jgi:hypothetical protein